MVHLRDAVMRLMYSSIPALVAGLSLISTSFPTGASEDGEALFNAQCKACHEVGAGARNKVGPHLDGIVGRVAGTVDGFKYSSAMREAGEGGLAWNHQALSDYLQKPRDFISGNRMSYRGLADAQKREALVNWLEQVSLAEPDSNAAAGGAVAATSAPGFADIILQIEGDRDYGEYLSGDCVTCHQVSGKADGIPSIVGIPKDYFVKALVEYKTNVRQNEVMKLRVANLTNEEIAALAAYFETLTPQ